MIQLWLIRHGNKESGYHYDPATKVQNPPLTPLGFRQARAVSRLLSKDSFTAIYTSDLMRTRQTAVCIGKKLKQEVIPTPALREIFFGEVEALTREEIDVKFPAVFENYYLTEKDTPYPGGETGVHVLERLIPFIGSLYSKDGARYLLITHGGTIRVFLSYILAMDLGKRFRLGDPPGECSITRVNYYLETDRYALDLFNYTGSLQR